ncbi:hypothetical protein QBC39DRAFT_97919 [Podospora conica]|nr:hypothetical protein QBC39DRAFT_97919 [Schizothecium conicum]
MDTPRPAFKYEPRGDSSSVPLTISYAKIQGRTQRAQTADRPRFSLAKLNHQLAQANTVTPAALNHIVDPAKLYAHQNVELGWRLHESGTLFTTLHRVVPEPIDSAGHNISFTGNLEWTTPITDLVNRFSQFADQHETSIPRSLPNQPNYAESLLRRVGSQSPESVTTPQGLLGGATVGRATASEQRRLQACQSLVEARQQYAHEKYLETGDTQEVLKTMQQSQVVAASAFQHYLHQEGADEWW